MIRGECHANLSMRGLVGPVAGLTGTDPSAEWPILGGADPVGAALAARAPSRSPERTGFGSDVYLGNAFDRRSDVGN